MVGTAFRHRHLMTMVLEVWLFNVERRVGGSLCGNCTNHPAPLRKQQREVQQGRYANCVVLVTYHSHKLSLRLSITLLRKNVVREQQITSHCTRRQLC